MTQANVGGNTISNGKTVKLLWITVDNKLSFESDLNKNAKKKKKKIYVYTQRLHALARISTFISQKNLEWLWEC